MTNKRASLFDMFIGRAEASDLDSVANVSLPASRPTMEQRQEAQGDFAFEGPAA